MGTAFLVLRVEVMERRPEGGIDGEGRVVKPPLSAQQHESQLCHGRRMMEGGTVLLLSPGGWEPEEGWYCPLARVNPSWWWVQERGGLWFWGNRKFRFLDPSIPAIRTLKCQKINGETVSANS